MGSNYTSCTPLLHSMQSCSVQPFSTFVDSILKSLDGVTVIFEFSWLPDMQPTARILHDLTGQSFSFSFLKKSFQLPIFSEGLPNWKETSFFVRGLTDKVLVQSTEEDPDEPESPPDDPPVGPPDPESPPVGPPSFGGSAGLAFCVNLSYFVNDFITFAGR